MEQSLLPSFHIQQFFKASPELVFDAWSNPELIKQWMFRSDTNEILHVHNYLQPNGAFSIVEKTQDGTHIDHFGKYFWIVKPYRLSFSLKVSKHFSEVTSVSVSIDSKEEGCELNFQQTGVKSDIMEKSWYNTFSYLHSLLNK
jgi:uncharacterized protein YndB with AHSA1/START domain